MAENPFFEGICPKCGSDDVYFLREESMSFDKQWRTTYACLNCGYREIYREMSEKQKDRIRRSRQWQRPGGKRKSKPKNDDK